MPSPFPVLPPLVSPSRFRPFLGPSARPLPLHSRPWPSGASPALSPPAQAPGNHPSPKVFPRPVSAPPSFPQHLSPLGWVLTAYPGPTLEPGRAPRGSSGFLPGAPGLPRAPFASPTPLWNPWTAPLYLPRTLPGPPGPSMLSLDPWSPCWLFLGSSLGPQASPRAARAFSLPWLPPCGVRILPLPPRPSAASVASQRRPAAPPL